jgi:hypothetical protein
VRKDELQLSNKASLKLRRCLAFLSVADALLGLLSGAELVRVNKIYDKKQDRIVDPSSQHTVQTKNTSIQDLLLFCARSWSQSIKSVM